MLPDLPNQLLHLAIELISGNQTQAKLRRAVSTAYYALFHLLIRDAVEMWSNPRHYPRLSRAFEHAQMKVASEKVSASTNRDSETEPGIQDKLKLVAEAFVDLQQARYRADYVTYEELDPNDAVATVVQAATAFGAWEKIKREDTAQDYLYSLLFKDRTS